MSERACRVCGCTELQACRHPNGTPCCWVDDDLCSVCDDLMHTPAIDDVAAERARQVQKEGWTPEHDDQYDGGDLAGAAACYAMNAGGLLYPFNGTAMELPPAEWWPFGAEYWKPARRSEDARRDLVKAGALILAEIERIDRAAEKS